MDALYGMTIYLVEDLIQVICVCQGAGKLIKCLEFIGTNLNFFFSPVALSDVYDRDDHFRQFLFVTRSN